MAALSKRIIKIMKMTYQKMAIKKDKIYRTLYSGVHLSGSEGIIAA